MAFKGYLKREFERSTVERLQKAVDLDSIRLATISLLKKMAQDLGFQGAEDQIKCWLMHRFEPDVMALLNCREKPNAYWRILFCEARAWWKGACQIATSFVTAGTSEAEVERTLSRKLFKGCMGVPWCDEFWQFDS
jgi:hypothetical protein